MDKVIGKIEELDYYKFSLKMEELQHAQSKQKIKELHASLLDKDLENLKLRVALHKHLVSDGRAEVNEVLKGYNEFREELSNKLNIDLKDAVIDGVTLEIKKME